MKPIRKHVFVCGGGDCSPRGDGGENLFRRLRRKLLVRGLLHGGNLPGDIRVAKTSCIGGCGHGPMIAIYPEGVFYSEVSLDDLEEIIENHLLQNRLVERLYFFRSNTVELAGTLLDHATPRADDMMSAAVDQAVEDIGEAVEDTDISVQEDHHAGHACHSEDEQVSQSARGFQQ